MDLIRVGREEKAIEEDNLAACERRRELGGDELCPRGHEERGLRARFHRILRVEQELPDAVPERGAPRFATAPMRDLRRGQVGSEATELGGLPRPLSSLEDDEQATPHEGHPRVMIELVAPFLIPSRIHWFTCIITLSKFSFAERTRW